MYNRDKASPVHSHYGKTHAWNSFIVHTTVLSKASVSVSELLVEIVRDPPSCTSITQPKLPLSRRLRLSLTLNSVLSLSLSVSLNALLSLPNDINGSN